MRLNSGSTFPVIPHLTDMVLADLACRRTRQVRPTAYAFLLDGLSRTNQKEQVGPPGANAGKFT